MSQSTTFTRGELSDSFDDVRGQVEIVLSLLDAIEDQHQMNNALVNQMSGVTRLLRLLDSDLEDIQQRADEVEAWAHVTVKRAREGIL